MRFNLRLSNNCDLERLRIISAQSRSRYRSLPKFAYLADTPPLTAARFEVCRVEVAVDETNGEVVAFAAMRPLDGLLYLDNISVEAGFSGHGIGKALLTATFAYAKSLNAPAVTLTTFQEPVWNGP